MIIATPTHAAALAAIHAEAFPEAEAWGERDFAAQLGLPGVTGLIHPQGGLVLLRVVADEAEILTLGVVPRARRRGIGRALLEAALSRAAGEGAGVVFLEVAEHNAPARALYAAAGFGGAGRRPLYYAGGRAALVLSHRPTQPMIEDHPPTATAKKSYGITKVFVAC